MNPSQLKLKKNESVVRTGGKGSVRRKKRVVRRPAGGEDKKLQATLKKLSLNQIPVDQVLMYKADGQVIEFNKPRLQANVQGNTYVISGRNTTRSLIPDDLATTIPGLSKLVEQVKGSESEFPDVGGDFETTAEDNVEEIKAEDAE